MYALFLCGAQRADHLQSTSLSKVSEVPRVSGILAYAWDIVSNCDAAEPSPCPRNLAFFVDGNGVNRGELHRAVAVNLAQTIAFLN